ncbi:MAG: hypothetical protein JST20_10420 [Bacteroidetes bacterium]|nr:hypothetical protein [Bacteroidota bacterium]
MKTFKLLVVLLIFPFYASQATSWQRLDADFQKVRYFPQIGKVFALGTNGCLLYSEDKGINWKQVVSKTNKSLFAMDFATSAIGVVVGDSGCIVRTIDSGKTWQNIQSNTQYLLRTVQFTTKTDGYAGGLYGTLLKTTDAGATWKSIPLTNSVHIGAISMSSPQSGIIVGSGSTILTTNDSWDNWDSLTINSMPTGDFDFRICIRGTIGEIYLSGINYKNNTGTIVISSDGKIFTGREFPVVNDMIFSKDTLFVIDVNSGISKVDITTLNFSPILIGDSRYAVSSQNLTSFCFIDSSIAIAVGLSKIMYRTTIATDYWSLVSYFKMNTTEAYTSIFFVNDTIGYICGSTKYLFRTQNAGATWLPQEQNVPGAINLPYTNDIYFTSPKNGFGATSSGKYPFVKTIDGGKSYTGNYILTGYYPKVRFLNDSIGICVDLISISNNALIGILHLTKDGGTTWKTSFFDGGLVSAHYRNDSTILLCGSKKDKNTAEGYRGIIYLSTNGGSSWDSVSMPFSGFLSDCWMVDNSTMFLTGSASTNNRQYGIIYHSSNGGKSWEILDSSNARGAVAVKFINEKVGYILYLNKLIQTKDGGKTWEIIAQALEFSNLEFGRIACLPNGNIILSSYTGNLYRSYVDKSINAVDVPPIEYPSGAVPVWLRNPSPNPFNEVLRAEVLWLPIVSEDEISFEFTNILGQRPYSPVSYQLTRGNPPIGAEGYRGGMVEVRPSANLPSGIYILSIGYHGFLKALPVIIAR